MHGITWFAFLFCFNITRIFKGAEHDDGWLFCWTCLKTILNWCGKSGRTSITKSVDCNSGKPTMNEWCISYWTYTFPLLPMSISPLYPSNHVRESVRISSPTSGTSSATLPRFLTRFLRDDKSRVDQTTKIEAADMIVVLIFLSNKTTGQEGSIHFFDISWISFLFRKEPNQRPRTLGVFSS